MEENLKAAAFFPDVVLSDDYSKTAWQRAFRSEKTLWESWRGEPGRTTRLQMAMVGLSNMRPHHELQDGMSNFQLRVLILITSVQDLIGLLYRRMP